MEGERGWRERGESVEEGGREWRESCYFSPLSSRSIQNSCCSGVHFNMPVCSKSGDDKERCTA